MIVAHSAVLRKVGGSVMVAIPPALLQLMRLAAGGHVALSLEHGRLVVEPQEKPKYTLDELLAQCDENAQRDPSDSEWLESPIVGEELL